jgi:hypothetical protein
MMRQVVSEIIAAHGTDVVGELVIERIAEALERGAQALELRGLLLTLEVLLAIDGGRRDAD